MEHASATPALPDLPLAKDVFTLFPFAIVVLGHDGRLLMANDALFQMLGQPAGEFPVGTCCELLGCGKPGTPLAYGCVTRMALEAGHPLPEIRVDLPSASATEAAWVTAAPLGEKSRVVVSLRPGSRADRRRRTVPHWLSEQPQLYVRALGSLRVDGREDSLGGRWLSQRPGLLLKYLLAERHRTVPADEIAYTLWPQAGLGALNNVRHFVHQLRKLLEPERPKGAPASFIVASGGGYTIDLLRVRVDADEFEDRVTTGLVALADGEKTAGVERLRSALDLYRGEFLADEPYAEWAIRERDRLRDLAGKALRALVDVSRRDYDLDTAAALLNRLSELEPFDSDLHRELIALCLQRGRNSEAHRRFAALRIRMEKEFGQQPGFRLSELG